MNTATATGTSPTLSKRFSDNTTVAPVDRRRVYGFAPGAPYMVMSPSSTNLQRKEIPLGQLILFKPKVDRHVDGDWKPAILETSAKAWAENVAKQFQVQEDWGYRTLEFLTPLEYDKTTGFDEADAYFETVHPSFNQVGRSCEMGLDTGNFNSDNYFPCAKCRVEWLESAEVSQRIDIASGGEYPLNRAILENLRTVLLDSYRQGLTFNQNKLNETKADMQTRSNGGNGVGAYSDADYLRMRILHRKDDHIEQAELVAKQAVEQGRAIAAGLNEFRSEAGNPTSGMSNAELAEFYAWRAAKDAAAETPTAVAKCSAQTKDKKPCGNDAKENGKCAVHKDAQEDVNAD